LGFLWSVGGALPAAHHGQRRVWRPLPGHRRHLPDAPLRFLHVVAVVRRAGRLLQARQDGERAEGQSGRHRGARAEQPRQQRRGEEHGAQEQ
ncbi:hypothetical protein BAE44_0013324, partial [Dichanthelium oligosanthes]